MKNTIKKFLMITFLTLLISNCALLAKLSLTKLELRTLRISKDFAGLEYRYCKKKKFLSSECKTWQVDKYDLNDLGTRLKLINMGFVARVRKTP